MEESLYGSRDKRGYWRPKSSRSRAPVFVWPARPKAFLRWLFGFPGYLWPWQVVFFSIACVMWFYLTPSLDTMREFQFSWVSLILLRNALLAALVYGGLHTVFYILRWQKTEFKYNEKWPDTDNSTFLFGSQTAENVFWTMCSGVPIWTAYEVLTWWMFANGYIPYLRFEDHPIYFVALTLSIMIWRELHFYLIHRLIHVGPLYHIIHKVHHNSVNPGTWSGLSMHPFEHVLFFSGVLLYWIVPSHPLHAMYHLVHAAVLAPSRSHLGFDRMVVDGEHHIPNDHYYHYLHHRYFEVNYGDTLIPFDEWFGTAHDGSSEADERMYERLKAKKYARGGSR